MLVSDRPDAQAHDRARRLGIEALTLPVGRYRSRIEDEWPWLEALRERGVETLLLAGFMRRLHTTILDAFPHRVLNIHPSLLPAFPGLDAIGQAWRAGAKVTGCTVHLVEDELDLGPILAQSVCEIEEADTLERLAGRMHKAEHELYPRTVRRFLSEPWQLDGRRVLWEGDAPAAAGMLAGELAGRGRAGR